jgi:hypothetical protein
MPRRDVDEPWTPNTSNGYAIMRRPRPPLSFLAPGCRLSGLCLIVATSALACGEEPAPQGPPPLFDFSIEVQVVDQEKKPLAKVPVLVDGRTVGYTDREGTFSAVITERPRANLTLSLGPLDGYRFTTPHSLEEELRVQRGVSGEPQGLPIALRAEAQSLLTNYLFWVKLTCDEHIGPEACANLPVRLDGEIKGKTDRLGMAQIAFRGVPDRTVKLVVDTPPHVPTNEESRFYEPARPTYEIKLDFDNSIYVIEENVTDPLRAQNRGRGARRPAAPRPATASSPAPARQPAQKTAPPPEKKPDTGRGGIIDLF